MVEKKTIRDVKLKGMKCLVRVDFNVPTDPTTHTITDESRIKASLPTIRHLLANGASVLLCTHYGRPKGQMVENLRVTGIRERVSRLLNQGVIDAGYPTSERSKSVSSQLRPGQIAMLENIRFHPGEEANAHKFARELALLANVFVNDAFGASHRRHASTTGLTAHITAVAGLLMEKEIEMLNLILQAHKKPALAIVGGAKVYDKIQVLNNLSKKMDTIIVGGAMISAFLEAQGQCGGKSKITRADVEIAERFRSSTKAQLIEPNDVIIGESFELNTKIKHVDVTSVPYDWFIMDIGPKTRQIYTNKINECKTILWNGPLGVVEWPNFSKGTYSVAKSIANTNNAVTVTGGGSTAAVMDTLGLRDSITHVSTGGGATLKFLEGKSLPGIDALDDKQSTSEINTG